MKQEYQEIINLLGNLPDTRTIPKFNTKKRVEVNDLAIHIIQIICYNHICVILVVFILL